MNLRSRIWFYNLLGLITLTSTSLSFAERTSEVIPPDILRSIFAICGSGNTFAAINRVSHYWNNILNSLPIDQIVPEKIPDYLAAENGFREAERILNTNNATNVNTDCAKVQTLLENSDAAFRRAISGISPERADKMRRKFQSLAKPIAIRILRSCHQIEDESVFSILREFSSERSFAGSLFDPEFVSIFLDTLKPDLYRNAGLLVTLSTNLRMSEAEQKANYLRMLQLAVDIDDPSLIVTLFSNYVLSNHPDEMELYSIFDIAKRNPPHGESIFVALAKHPSTHTKEWEAKLLEVLPGIRSPRVKAELLLLLIERNQKDETHVELLLTQMSSWTEEEKSWALKELIFSKENIENNPVDISSFLGWPVNPYSLVSVRTCQYSMAD